VAIKVRLHPRARRDLADIREYIRRTDGPQKAERVRLHLKSRIERLGQAPQLGITSSEADIKILSPTLYPYRIYFMRTTDAVVVLHVRHTSRHLPEPEEVL
jgi:plasmid stabilization system protein ParE